MLVSYVYIATIRLVLGLMTIIYCVYSHVNSREYNDNAKRDRVAVLCNAKTPPHVSSN